MFLLPFSLILPSFCLLKLPIWCFFCSLDGDVLVSLLIDSRAGQVKQSNEYDNKSLVAAFVQPLFGFQ